MAPHVGLTVLKPDSARICFGFKHPGRGFFPERECNIAQQQLQRANALLFRGSRAYTGNFEEKKWVTARM